MRRVEKVLRELLWAVVLVTAGAVIGSAHSDREAQKEFFLGYRAGISDSRNGDIDPADDGRIGKIGVSFKH